MSFDALQTAQQAASFALVGGALDYGLNKLVIKSNSPSKQFLGTTLSGDQACAISTTLSVFAGEMTHAYLERQVSAYSDSFLGDYRQLAGPAIIGGYQLAIDKATSLGESNRNPAMSLAKGAVMGAVTRYAANNVLKLNNDKLSSE